MKQIDRLGARVAGLGNSDEAAANSKPKVIAEPAPTGMATTLAPLAAAFVLRNASPCEATFAGGLATFVRYAITLCSATSLGSRASGGKLVELESSFQTPVRGVSLRTCRVDGPLSSLGSLSKA